QDLALDFQIAAGDRGPGRDIIETVPVSVGRSQQQLYRGDTAGELFELAPQLRQIGDAGSFQIRQQRLANDAALVAYALQQQRLAILIGLLELDIEEDGDQCEDHRQNSRLGAQ